MSEKRDVWLAEYLKSFNATDAARKAGYAWPNKSGPANKIALADEIAEKLDELSMSSEEALVRLSEQARAEYSKYLYVDDALAVGVDVQAMIDDNKAHLIKAIKETPQGQVIEFYDAQTALVQIGRARGIFTDKVEHSGEITQITHIKENRPS